MEKQPSYFQRDMGVSQLVDPVSHQPEPLVEPLVPNGKELYYVELADVALQDLKENHATGSNHEMDERRRLRNGVRKSKNLRPLCYEHHIEMKPSHLPTSKDKPRQMHCYVCPKRGCSVGYNSRQGYFKVTTGRECTERNMTPCVSCPSDGQLMYLAQVKPDKRSFRLWRCPQCKGSRTNGELLQG
jgi:hypothetical protein